MAETTDMADRTLLGGDGHIFEEIADAMPHMVWLASHDGASVYHNRRFLEYAGLTPAAARGSGWAQMVHPEDLPATQVAWARSVATGDPFEVECRLRNRDGQYRWFIARGQAQRDSGGRVVRWVGTCTDVSHERVADARCRAIIENSFEVINLVAADGTLIYSTTRSAAFLGMPIEELLGCDVFNLVHPDDQGAVRSVFRSLLADPSEAAYIVFRGRQADGSWRWLEARSTNLLRDPAVGAVVINFRDVTERIAFEERVRESERVYRELFDANPHPMWVYDTQTLRFLAVNDAAVERYGYSRDEFLSMTIAEIRPSEDVPALLEDIRKRGTGLQPGGMWRHRWKDGTIRNVEVSSNNLRFADRPARLVLSHDVTDRVRALETAARGHARLQAVVETLYDGVVVSDPAGNLLGWNSSALRMHGFTTVEAAPPHMPAYAETFSLSRLDKAPLSRIDWPMSRVLHGQQVADEEFILRRHDTGLELVVRCSGAPVLGPDGSVELGVVTFHDVTPWKRAESDARRTAGLLRAVVDGTSDAVYVKDCAGRYLLFNKAAAGFVGKPIEEVLGKDDTTLFDPDSARQVMERDRRVMESGRVETEEEVLEAAGTTRIYQATKAPYRDADGRVIGLIGISRDVTVQKRAEEEHRRTQKRLQHVISSSPAVLFTVAIADDQIRSIAWISENVRVMLGHSPEEATGPDWWARNIHPEDRESVASSTRDRLFVNGHVTHEFRLRRTDGEYRWVHSESRLLREASGKAVEAVGSWSDITERKQIEESLHQVQKMEAIGRLAGGVAHDFNNLLTIINGYADELLEGIPATSPNHTHVVEIRNAGGRAARLTAQLLAFSRKSIIEPRALDLNDIVSQCMTLLNRLIGEDVVLVANLASKLSRVRADAGQVEQVIINLSVNARDAMPTGGRLTIETREHFVSELHQAAYSGLVPGHYVQLSVTDNGLGMSADVKAKVFEPFFTTKGVGRGTGLGLATVYGIVKTFGGHIEVKSQVGVGTTFEILFPAVKEDVVKLQTDDEVEVASKECETILLVEDEAAVRGIAKLVLKKKGYVVLEAGSGAESLLVAEGHSGPIDLLVTDVVMPGMSGREVAEAMRKRYPDLKVLYVSGYMDDAVLRHGIVEATDAFLQKPFSPVSLARKVRNVLDGGR